MRIVVIDHLTLDGVMQALVDPMRTTVVASATVDGRSRQR
jgi:hypothetical protein